MRRPDLGWLLRDATTTRPARRPRASTTPRDWYRVRAMADTTEIWLYDEIGWYGLPAQAMIDELKTITTPTITLRINSPGGDVFDGLAIYQALVTHPATVVTRIDGLAASAASLIAQAGDTVHIGPQAMMMIHDAWGVCVGNATDMTATAALLDKISDAIADLYAQRGGGDPRQWRDLMRAETWYTGAEAVTAGLADEVIPIGPRRREDEDGEDGECRTADDAVMSHAWDLSIFSKAPERTPAETGPTSPPRATACPTHHTPVVETTWDSSANTTRLGSPIAVDTAHAVYAWYDPTRVTDDDTIIKDACKLPHHQVDPDGTPGAAVANGVRNALSRLPQTDIPDDERGAVEDHLRAHLDDLDTTEDTWTGLTASLLHPRDTFASLTEGLLA